MIGGGRRCSSTLGLDEARVALQDANVRDAIALLPEIRGNRPDFMSRFFEIYTIIVQILPRFDRCNFGQLSNRRDRQSIHAVIAALAWGAVLAQAPGAVAQTPGPSETRELVIGTKVAPPFAMKAQDGTWLPRK